MTLGIAQWILVAVAVQRLAELAVARRNMRALLAAGAAEHGAAHYPLLVGLHAGWLAALAWTVDATTPVSWPLLAVFALLQLARLWVIATLGRFWTTRIVSLPGAALVRRGPYRLMRHPNYAVVAAEIAVLPLAFGALGVAALFTLLNAAVLAIRIRTENAALQARSALRPGQA